MFITYLIFVTMSTPIQKRLFDMGKQKLKELYKKLFDRAQKLSMQYGMGYMYVNAEMVQEAFAEAEKVRLKLHKDKDK